MILDLYGKQLSIGDEVAVTPKNYRGLVKAEIIQFTPKSVRVKYMNTWNHGLPGREETYLVPQKCCSKAVVKLW